MAKPGAQNTLRWGRSSSYLLPEPLGLDGLLGLLEPPGPAGFLAAPELPVPEVPLPPDEPELPVAELPPLEDLPLSRSHPATRVPLRANASAAANAVDFMLTSMVG